MSYYIHKKLVLCRLTLRSVEGLRDDLVSAGARCRYNKPKVVLSSLMHALTYLTCCRRGRSWNSIERIFDMNSEATPDAIDFLRR